MRSAWGSSEKLYSGIPDKVDVPTLRLFARLFGFELSFISPVAVAFSVVS